MKRKILFVNLIYFERAVNHACSRYDLADSLMARELDIGEVHNHAI